MSRGLRRRKGSRGNATHDVSGNTHEASNVAGAGACTGESTDVVATVSHLTKTFPAMDKPALNGVSVTIEAGQITGLVGPDGAGKTTLIRHIMGLMHGDAGTIRVCGLNPTIANDAAEISHLVGYMPQKFGLYEELSVQENLNFYANLRRLPDDVRQEKFNTLLKFTNLEPFQKRLAGKLSGGMKQKLGLACALLGDPKLLLLDEPSVGVDPISRRELWQMVQNLAKHAGNGKHRMAVVWATSYLDEAEKCNQILLLSDGNQLYHGKPQQILTQVAGRTWHIQGVPENKRRQILMNLVNKTGVVDGVIQGRNIRIVMAKNTTKPELTLGEWVEVEPWLEDAFIDTLKTTPDASPTGLRPTNPQGLPPLTRATQRRCIRKGNALHPLRFASVTQPPRKTNRLFGRALPYQPTRAFALDPSNATALNPEGQCPSEDYESTRPQGDAHIGSQRLGLATQSGLDATPCVSVIDARNLSKHYGDFVAVRDNSFRVSRGEIFGLLGPNGAGKSTTFKMMCGLTQPTSGESFVAGLSLRTSTSLARSRIGYMAQKFSLYGSLTLHQNLKLFAGLYGLSGQRRRQRVRDMVEMFDFESKMTMDAGDLPLGFKQRLALACAIMHQPDVLFLDEPTSGVDPLTRREFWMHINAMVETGVTVMVTTHFMDEAEYCDRIGLIYNSENIATGTPDDLKVMARQLNPDLADPTLEDAFIELITHSDKSKAEAEGGS